MPADKLYEAVVVGAGPNGLAAAVTLARAGRSVLVIEAHETIGGGTRTDQLTLPGFWHDVCSAIHPLGGGSPFFRELSLSEYGLEWIQPPAPLAHPLEDGSAAMLERSTQATGETLGQDARAYRRLMDPFVGNYEKILEDFLGPLPLPPRHPVILARFGLKSIRPARSLVESHFQGPLARAMFAGIAAHSILPLEKLATSGAGMLLSVIGHALGWPMPRRGSQRITEALAGYLRSLGGEIITGRVVKSLDDLPPARGILFDVTPRQLLRIAGERLPAGYRRQLQRYRYGMGVFKVDWALSEPVPWKAKECLRAGTVHVGGAYEEIAAGEAAVWSGQHPEKPFVLFAQQSLFDPTRAPHGQHTGWAYCHVPSGSTFDMTDRIEAQVERFAPGFRDCILARHVISPAWLEAYNQNYIGGDIIGGVQDIWQQFTRPTISLNPYKTPAKGIYLCSSSTPPGGGVHGICGFRAAQEFLKDANSGPTPIHLSGQGAGDHLEDPYAGINDHG
jgi:phytoene dehydrogenase-like protein